MVNIWATFRPHFQCKATASTRCVLCVFVYDFILWLASCGSVRFGWRNWCAAPLSIPLTLSISLGFRISFATSLCKVVVIPIFRSYCFMPHFIDLSSYFKVHKSLLNKRPNSNTIWECENREVFHWKINSFVWNSVFFLYIQNVQINIQNDTQQNVVNNQLPVNALEF